MGEQLRPVSGTAVHGIRHDHGRRRYFKRSLGVLRIFHRRQQDLQVSIITVVVTRMFLRTLISGSTGSFVSAMGSMTIPFLVNMGYDVVFSRSNRYGSQALGGIIPAIYFLHCIFCSGLNALHRLPCSSLRYHSWMSDRFLLMAYCC